MIRWTICSLVTFTFLLVAGCDSGTTTTTTNGSDTKPAATNNGLISAKGEPSKKGMRNNQVRSGQLP
jgi:hypothetical protein